MIKEYLMYFKCFGSTLQSRIQELDVQQLCIFDEIDKSKAKQSPIGKYKLIVKKMTGEFSKFKINQIDCICKRDDNYKQYNVICRLCQNSGFLSSENIHEIILTLLQTYFSEGKIPPGFCEEWTKHHFRYTFWKLLAFERNCKDNIELCNPENIIQDLLKKFDFEFIKGNRSFLQRVMDTDESASRHCVLLVANIEEVVKDEKYILELYDGRYSLYSVLNNKESGVLEDEMQIIKLIQEKKIFLGQKLHIAGLSILNQNIDECIQSKGNDLCKHDFLSKVGTCSLVLNYNSISRARINEKLGYYDDLFLTKWLKDINQQCGPVSRINVYITKVYPVYFVQKINEKKSVLRSNLCIQELQEKAADEVSKQCAGMKDTGLNEEQLRQKIDKLVQENQEKFRLFFKLKVIDAMYNEEKLLSNKRDTIITVMDTNFDMYESFQVGDRVVFYGLFMDTYGKNGRNKSYYLDERLLTLQYKSKRSHYDNLRHLGIASDNDKQIGKSRVEIPVTFDKLFENLARTYEKIKTLEEKEKLKIIKQDIKLHEVSLVGLILKISANEVEYSCGVKCIKKLYLLLPKHHLMILNITDQYFYTQKSFPCENTLVILDCIYFQELVDLNISDKSISSISMLDCEKWIHSKTLSENHTAYVLSFITSNQTNIIPEKTINSKYLKDPFYCEDIKRLKKCIDSNDSIINRRCEEIGMITQSAPPVFSRDFKVRPKIIQDPPNSFKIDGKDSSFNLGSKTDLIEEELNIEVKPQLLRKRPQFKPLQLGGSCIFNLKRRKTKEAKKSNEQASVKEVVLSKYKRQKTIEDEKHSDIEMIDEIPKSQDFESQNQIENQSQKSEHTPYNNEDSVIFVNENLSHVTPAKDDIQSADNNNYECKSEGSKSNKTNITFNPNENHIQECIYSSPEIKIVKDQNKKTCTKKVIVSVKKSNSSSDGDISVCSKKSNFDKTSKLKNKHNKPISLRIEVIDPVNNDTLLNPKDSESQVTSSDIEIRLDSEPNLQSEEDFVIERVECISEQQTQKDSTILNCDKKPKKRKKLIKSDDENESKTSTSKRNLRKRKKKSIHLPKRNQSINFLEDNESNANGTIGLDSIQEMQGEDIEENTVEIVQINEKIKVQEKIEDIDSQ